MALSVVQQPRREAEAAIRTLRRRLPDAVELWVGGRGAGALRLPPGVRRVDDPDELEQAVAGLALRTRRRLA